MAEWDIWVQDTRRVPLSRARAKQELQHALSLRGLSLVDGPWILVPPKKYPGAWICRIHDSFEHPEAWMRLRLKEVLTTISFELRRQPFPRKPRST